MQQAGASTEIVRLGPLGDRLADTLRERILLGEIPAGTHLVEDIVAEEYGVSRGPVRDALKQLQAENLVEPRKRGVHVLGMQESDVTDLYAIRAAIEGLAARLTIERGDDVDWSSLEEALRELETGATDGDRGEFALADLQFHSTLYQLSGNRRLAVLWEQYEPTFRAMLGLTSRRDKDLTTVAKAHQAIYETLKVGDTAKAVALLDDHIRHACELMVESMNEVWARR